VALELSYDPLVDDSDISVKNLNGDVALNGTVPSYPQYMEAAAAARRVAGVTKLQNHLEVVLPPENYRDDPALTTTANDALTLNVAVPDGVEATAKDGNITLTGTVSCGAERIAAEQAVTYLTGVRNVKDDIDINTDADPVDVTLNVQDALDRYALIPDDSDVAVDTSGNGDADRPRPHLGRARRGGRRGVAGHRRLRRNRRPVRHRLTGRYSGQPGPSAPASPGARRDAYCRL
jgi:osmotically-inducible protein OsmY